MKKNLALAMLLTAVICSSCNVGVKKEALKNELNTDVSYHLEQAWMTDSVLRTPESVCYDSVRNYLYVSNINSGSEEGNGFISRLGMDGEILDLHFVGGLKSPKGLAMSGDKLYVADVDELVEIDVDKAIVLQHYPAIGSTMLNDVAADGQGNVYVSDSDTSAIYHFHDGRISEWMREGLDHPNGLYIDGSRMLVAMGGKSRLDAIDMKTKNVSTLTENIEHGDGITPAGSPGYWLVSDWSGEIYMIYPDNHKVSLLNTKDEKINTADINYIAGKNLLLVPTFFANRIVAYHLVKE